MNHNPYATESVAAISAAAEERATFLQRTYLMLLAGVGVFAGTIWAADNVPAIQNLAIGLWRTHPLLVLALLFGAGFGVRAVANKHPINLVAYFAYAFFFGLLLAPASLYAAEFAPDVLSQAVVVTLLVFSGLTAYVFVSGKDFSFMRGALVIASLILFAVLIGGWIFGYTMGLWMSVAFVALYAGFILYDTSRILHHYPTNAHVAAAIELFVSLIMLFQWILNLLLSMNDD